MVLSFVVEMGFKGLHDFFKNAVFCDFVEIELFVLPRKSPLFFEKLSHFPFQNVNFPLNILKSLSFQIGKKLVAGRLVEGPSKTCHRLKKGIFLLTETRNLEHFFQVFPISFRP